ncbi:Tigger transposable element-derived protein 4 [Araneus ventricosus]|uniref:Tigger transposable element-derived protein 4 n=1 Tax=Araneus ventricosus TaxID=182803 RepID=A0A4Y2L4U0_ARAVE|nr:Tigger transposable element-derived protein 4 [Araneus ventricosus]
MESEKKKIPREVLPLYKRICVIESATAGLSQRQLAEKFNCGKTQISNILRNKDALLKEWEANNHRKSVKRKRRSVYENVNVLVLEWYKRAIAEGQPINAVILQEKALEYAEALNFPAFKASSGWLDNMRRRHGILCNGTIGENRANTSKDEQGIQEIIEGYDAQDIYNLGEAGLLFRALPDKSLIEKEKQCQGGKLSNERLTIGFCCNAVGEKEIPVVITRFNEPSSFEGMDLTSLGIKHKYSKKAWMTSEIFEEWINELNERMRNRKKRILILVDYAPCHPNEISLSNVAVKFLPPNPLSPLQPLDQGIIQSFKVLYRKNLLKMIFSRTSNPAEFSSLAKSLTLFDAVQFIKYAWNEVAASTIQRCFSACGLSVLIPQSNEEGRSLNELKLLCSASQINDCTFYEDVEFCEDRPSEWEEEMETDSSASKNPILNAS